MGFTTACFIKKDTSELRNKLEELGYKNRCDKKGFYLRTHYKNTIGQNTFCSRDDIPLEGLDCGTNEELFLAIATLRDDSDIHQWFVDDDIGKDWINAEDTSKLCDLWQGEPNIDDPFRTELENEGYQPFPYHKATVEELIEHFK